MRTVNKIHKERALEPNSRMRIATNGDRAIGGDGEFCQKGRVDDRGTPNTRWNLLSTSLQEFTVVRVAATGVADAWIVGRFLRARSTLGIEGVSAASASASMSFRFFWDWAGPGIIEIVSNGGVRGQPLAAPIT